MNDWVHGEAIDRMENSPEEKQMIEDRVNVRYIWSELATVHLNRDVPKAIWEGRFKGQKELSTGNKYLSCIKGFQTQYIKSENKRINNRTYALWKFTSCRMGIITASLEIHIKNLRHNPHKNYFRNTQCMSSNIYI